MARPKKEGLDYFPHDTDAVNDEKIEALRMLYGNDGYAFYFILLERIYRTNNAELDVSDAETIQILSRKIAITPQKFEQILETCFKRDCFDQEAYEERGVLTSDGIKKRMAPVVEKRQKMRRLYSKDKKEDSSEVSASETKKKPDKVKKRKVKESKEKKYDENSVPYQLAKQLYDRILENNPNHKQPDLQSWANDVRLMMERDKRTEEQIRYLIEWVQQDSFWKSNILSTSKLREKFDQLAMRCKEDIQKKNRQKTGQVAYMPRAFQSMQDYLAEGES